jgi:hypothetical protein
VVGLERVVVKSHCRRGKGEVTASFGVFIVGDDEAAVQLLKGWSD